MYFRPLPIKQFVSIYCTGVHCAPPYAEKQFDPTFVNRRKWLPTQEMRRNCYYFGKCEKLMKIV